MFNGVVSAMNEKGELLRHKNHHYLIKGNRHDDTDLLLKNFV